MPISLAELVAGATPDDIKQELVNLSALAGLPASAWQAGTLARTLYEGESITLSDLTQLASSIASGGWLDYATGGWLDLTASQVYQVTRHTGTITNGTVALTDVGGIGPLSIGAGQLWIQSASGLKYVNQTGGTLPASGTLTLSFAAETIGSSYNISDGSSLSLITSIPGVTAATYALPGGTWISQQGADQESDAALRARCKARWGELGYGATEAAYRYWALTASSEITRVGVFESTGNGIVYIRLAGTAGPVSGTAVTDVENYVEPRRPLCVRTDIDSASIYTVNVTGTAYVQAAYIGSVPAKVEEKLIEHSSNIAIGGIVYRTPIEVAIMQASPGMVTVNLSSPVADITLGSGEVPVFNVSLTYVTV